MCHASINTHLRRAPPTKTVTAQSSLLLRDPTSSTVNLSIQLLPMPICYSNNKPSVYRGDRAHFQPRTYTQWCKNRKQRAASAWIQLKVGKGEKKPSPIISPEPRGQCQQNKEAIQIILRTDYLPPSFCRPGSQERGSTETRASGLKLYANISSQTGTQRHGRRRMAQVLVKKGLREKSKGSSRRRSHIGT